MLYVLAPSSLCNRGGFGCDTCRSCRGSHEPHGLSFSSLAKAAESAVKIAFVGATRGMGRSLARLLAARGEALCLLGRDAADLVASARDLEARGARGAVATALIDLARPEGFGGALDAADRALGGFDALIVTGGDFARQEELAADPARLERLLHVNFTGTAVLCQTAAERLAARGGGTICAFSSVAGDRARRSNYLYGASKAGLSTFLDGLSYAYAERGVRVVSVRPGFVKTTMTAGLPVPPFAGDPDAVATTVLRAIDKGSPVVYAPPAWRWIMLVIRTLPRAVIRRIRF
jgi:short-subunit dehydrogenase